MNLAALQHMARSPFAYPADPSHLRVVVKAAQGDLAQVTCHFGDRYAQMEQFDTLPLTNLGRDGTYEYWGATLPVPTRRVQYLFHLEDGAGNLAHLGQRGPFRGRPVGADLFHYAYLHRADRFTQPPWLQGAVFYQIFPDRFANGDPNNDPEGVEPWGSEPTPWNVTGGDLKGITQNLDYLADLGINAIYTTPIFKSTSNHKYNTQDYYQIDPSFGTNEDFKELVAAAHEKGIRFLLDAVFNHSGHDWFAFLDVIEKGEASKYAGWFYDVNFPVDTENVNYESFATKLAWMPKLDTSNPELAEYLLKVAEYWIKEADIDGWRLDVANEVDHRFWRAFRDRVKAAKSDAWILGEVWHDATPWLQGDQYDSSMNYPWRDATLAFLKGEISAVEYDRELTRLRFNHPHEIQRGLLNLLGTHDTARVRTELGGSLEKAAQAAVLLLTSEGVPLIYYGDEIGLEGANDPGCRGCYPWGEPEKQSAELLSLHKRLIKIRRTFPWLNGGAWETLIADHASGLYAYGRLPTPLIAPEQPDDEEGLYIFINNSAKPASVEVGEGYRDLLEGEMLAGRLEGGTLVLPGRGVAVLAPSAWAC